VAKTTEKSAFLVDPSQLAVINDDDSPTDAALDNILEEFSDDTETSHVSVWRVVPREPTNPKGASKDEFLMKRSPLDFQEYGLDGLQADYGEGRYRIMVFGITEAGKKGLLRSRVVSLGPIDPYRKREIERQREIEERKMLLAPAPVAAPSADINSGLGQLATAMLQGFRDLQATMLAQKASRSDILAELAQVKTLFATPQNQQGGAQVENQLGLLTGIVSLAKELGGGGKVETSGMDLLKELIEQFGAPLGEVAKHAIVGVMQARGGPPQVIHAPQPAPGLPAPTIAAPAAPGFAEAGAIASGQPLNGGENVDIFGAVLNKYLPEFVAHAAHNHQAETYAIMIVETVPESMLLNFINRPDAIDYLASLNPGVNQFRPWFERLLAVVREELTEEPDENINGLIDGNSTTLQ
jgi:hypothetical protein